MRVSTVQFFYQNSLNLTSQNSKINVQSQHIAEEKRVLTAKDDAVAYGTLSGYKDELAGLERYDRNITQALNRNTQVETSFKTVQDVLQQVKAKFIQGNNGSLSDLDREALSDQLNQFLEQVLDVANSKDETGGYIFSGYQIDQQPFSLQPDNSVLYQGDSGIRELQVAKNVQVELNQPGDTAFMEVENALGDFSPSYSNNTGGISVSRAVIADRGTYDTATIPPDYEFTFTPGATPGTTDLNVVDNSGAGATVFTASPYVPGQTVSFNGIEVTIDGTPTGTGPEQIMLTPDEDMSIFETIKAAIDWLDVTGSAANTDQHSVDYGHILGQINTAINHVSTRQADAGINMEMLNNQRSFQQDAELVMTQGRSSIEDLDIYEAYSEFEQTKVALQAAQLTFSKLQGLSLLNYL